MFRGSCKNPDRVDKATFVLYAWGSSLIVSFLLGGGVMKLEQLKKIQNTGELVRVAVADMLVQLKATVAETEAEASEVFTKLVVFWHDERRIIWILRSSGDITGPRVLRHLHLSGFDRSLDEIQMMDVPTPRDMG